MGLESFLGKDWSVKVAMYFYRVGVRMIVREFVNPAMTNVTKVALVP